MAIPRRFTIAEASHRILDPFTPAKLADLAAAIGVRPGQTMLDLACGKGETLCLWARDHGITGLGVDLNPPFVAAARARAVHLGVADQVRFLEADAAGFVADAPVDIASCCGATWIGGGPVGTAALLARSLKPGGLVLLGDVYWREVPPGPEAVRGCGVERVEDFPTLPGLVDDLLAAGWDLVEMVHADEHSWDRYVAAQWLNLRRFIDAHPDDEIVPQLRTKLAEAPGRYVRYQRRYLGWGVFVLMRRT